MVRQALLPRKLQRVLLSQIARVLNIQIYSSGNSDINIRKSNIYFFLNLFFNILFIYLWLCWVFVAARGLSLVAASRGYSLRWLLLLWSMGSRRVGFSGCGVWAQLLRGMWDLPWPGLRTHVPCIGRWIVNHCTTREVPTFTSKVGGTSAVVSVQMPFPISNFWCRCYGQRCDVSLKCKSLEQPHLSVKIPSK